MGGKVGVRIAVRGTCEKNKWMYIFRNFLKMLEVEVVVRSSS